MTLAFFTNFTNHHQMPLADEFIHLLPGDYTYVTMNKPMERNFDGYSEIKRPYVLKAWESEETLEQAHQLFLESDVVINSYAPEDWVKKRLKGNKITFYFAERDLKTPVSHLNVRHWLSVYKHYGRFHSKPYYRLCASGFAAHDVQSFGGFKQKCFRWGYFPETNEYFRDDADLNNPIKIMSVARFLPWKHHELQILAASHLRDKGLDFILDIYGSGETYSTIEKMVKDLDLPEKVKLKGILPNSDLLKEMAEHDIFIHTADRNEGWGAVINESMAQGCAVICSNTVGAAPYLIQQGINGLTFQSGEANDLALKIESLILNPNLIKQYGLKARKTMTEMWSPKAAAENFLTLISGLQQGEKDIISEGPGSWEK